MSLMIQRQHGFTVIELIFIILLLSVASVLFFTQKNNIEVAARDNTRKTSLNAMYYSLEEVYYPTHHSYPDSISKDNLTSLDPTLFIDTNGITLGTAGSDYTYTPTNCTDGECQSYTLRSVLQNEDDFVKTSRHH